MKIEEIINLDIECDKSHGSPFDRGGADFYYSRKLNPHHRYNINDEISLTAKQIIEYCLGYLDSQSAGNKKEWE